MARLSNFTHQACAEACSVAKRGRDSSTESVSSPSHPAQSPLRPTHRTPDHVPPARKAARTAASATSPDDADVFPVPMPTSPLPNAGLLLSGPDCYACRDVACQNPGRGFR